MLCPKLQGRFLTLLDRGLSFGQVKRKGWNVKYEGIKEVKSRNQMHE